MKKKILSFTLLTTLATSLAALACDQCGCKLEFYKELVKNDTNLAEVQLVEVPSYKVISIRETGSYSKIAELTPKIIKYILSTKQLEMRGAPMLICHEQSAEEAEKANKQGTADVEICVPIAGNVEVAEPFKVYELEGGKMAKITHKGPYAECTKAYEKIYQWMVENKNTHNGFTREVYLNDPREIAESEILTDIYVPIK